MYCFVCTFPQASAASLGYFSTLELSLLLQGYKKGFLLRYVAEAAAWLGYCALLLHRAVQQLEQGVAYPAIYLTVVG